jgi:hypothetical protein
MKKFVVKQYISSTPFFDQETWEKLNLQSNPASKTASIANSDPFLLR